MLKVVTAFLVTAGTLGPLAGCSQNPLSQTRTREINGQMVEVTIPRSPYGRYQALRGGEPPMEEPDTFGRMRPALRERLQPMDRR